MSWNLTMTTTGLLSAAAMLVTAGAAHAGSIQISEIRIDQPGGDDDEYFELVGPASASLDDLTYVVIGDGAGSAGSGVIEAVVSLDGFSLDGNGFFVAAEGSFTLGSADLTTSLNFENSDNVTHLLVADFSGSDGDDLDTDDDGVLDVLPWSGIVDGVALIEEENPPGGTEFHYGDDLGLPVVGPDGSFVPGHAWRCSSTGSWEIGAFDPSGGDDTPGTVNPGCLSSLSLNPDDSCLNATKSTLTVTIDLTDATDLIVGGQFFLSYDNTVLDFISAEPGDAAMSDPDNPFETEIYLDADEIAGTIDYSVGVPDPPGTMLDNTMAVLTFDVLDDACDVSGLVEFRSHFPPTRLTNVFGDPIDAALNDLPQITIDQTLPVISCPSDVTIECDQPSDPNATGEATATDNCDTNVDVTHSDDTSGLDDCNGTGVIVRTWTATDDCGNTSTCEQTITIVDTTPPAIADCPDDITVPADAGGCDAVVSWTEPTATDNCGPATLVSQSHFPGEIFPQGTTTVTYEFQDDCGNASFCEFDVTVEPINELAVAVELLSVNSGPFDRCITFELAETGCGNTVVVNEMLTFNSGVAVAVIDVPCGSYECITARDALHTLQRTDDDGDFGIIGTQYVSDFTSTGTSNDALVGGNLNDDGFIDILDFGVYIGELNVDYGTPDTDCTTVAPHADIDGDGLVTTADFTFIQVNFLVFAESPCCVPLNQIAGGGSEFARHQPRNLTRRPLERVSVKWLRQNGYHDLIAADLNNDGWVDQNDVAAFAAGARP